MSSLQNPQSLRLLSLDGGGVKGLTTLLILKRIFRTLREEGKLEEEPKPCEIFDLIAGTSTGGLIAVMLGRLHMSVDECIEAYNTTTKKVFEKKPFGGKAGRFAKMVVSSPLYDVRILQECIKDILRQRGVPEDEYFRETYSPQCKVMICVIRQRTTKPDVLRTWETTCPTEENYECKIWEAASATAAAPMYFRRVKFSKQGEEWCDGGLQRNNPIRVLLSEAGREKTLKARKIGCVLSLGTGFPSIQSISPSLLGFLRGAVSMMTDSQKVAEEFLKDERFEELRTSHRYFRFNVPQGMEELELDECNETERMSALTANYLNQTPTGNEIQSCAQALLIPDVSTNDTPRRRASMLPYSRCINFVSRRFYSEALQKFFEEGNGEHQRFVLSGLGGSGKTQIALSFVHSLTEKFSVFWVRAESYSSFIVDFCRIPKIFRPDAVLPNNPTALAEEARTMLESSFDDWLLVLDNADNFDDFFKSQGNEPSIKGLVPKKGRVLITTRDHYFSGDFAPAQNCLRVKSMDRNEAKDLLSKSLPANLADSTGSHVQNLLDRLGDLPLGIAQAAANIRAWGWTLARFVQEYNDLKQRMELMQKPVYDVQTSDPHTETQSIFITWELTFERLEKYDSLAADCLNYITMFHWRDNANHAFRSLPAFKHLDEIDFQEIVKRLARLSLIEKHGDSGTWFDIHPLLHERIFQRLSTTAPERYLIPVIKLITRYFIRANSSATHDVRRRGIGTYFLLPHGMRLVELMGTLKFRSWDCFLLLESIGYYLTKTGRNPAATIFLLGALAMAPSISDGDDLSVYYTRKATIKSLIASMQYGEAERQCSKALVDLSNQSLGPRWILSLERNAILMQQSNALQCLHSCMFFRPTEKALLRELPALDSGDKLAIDFSNLMLAIARQPVRKAEAYELRQQHIEKIRGLEAEHGDLHTYLRQVEEDASACIQAKWRLKNGQLAFGDVWWNKHKASLERGELLNGLLFRNISHEEPDIRKFPEYLKLKEQYQQITQCERHAQISDCDTDVPEELSRRISDS